MSGKDVQHDHQDVAWRGASTLSDLQAAHCCHNADFNIACEVASMGVALWTPRNHGVSPSNYVWTIQSSSIWNNVPVSHDGHLSATFCNAACTLLPRLCTSHADSAHASRQARPCQMSFAAALACLRGNHLSKTTCLTHVFFKCGEYCSDLWCSLTWAKKARNERGRIRQVALDKKCRPNAFGAICRRAARAGFRGNQI